MDIQSFIHELDLIDRTVTLSINSCNNPYFDTFFYVFTQTWVWIPLIILLLILLYRDWKGKSLYIVFAIILVILLSDQISSSIIKPLVQRCRPTHDGELSAIMHVANNYRGGLYGFVSSHAANSFAFVILTSLIFKRKLYTVFFASWAILTSYSRIYLGVHYFGDVLCGALVGIIVSLIVYGLFKIIVEHISSRTILFQFDRISNYSNLLMTCALIVNIVIIAAYSMAVNIF